MPLKQALSAFAILLLCTHALAQDSPRYGRDKFRQLDQELPTPNEQRTASGAPGQARIASSSRPGSSAASRSRSAATTRAVTVAPARVQ